jgi:hypothetical protein
VACNVARDFAATGGVPHQRGVFEVERLDDGREIVGIAVHVISRRSLAGPAMAASIMCNGAEAILGEEQHLTVPGIGT